LYLKVFPDRSDKWTQIIIDGSPPQKEFQGLHLLEKAPGEASKPGPLFVCGAHQQQGQKDLIP
jgi:hypothetical protein